MINENELKQKQKLISRKKIAENPLQEISFCAFLLLCAIYGGAAGSLLIGIGQRERIMMKLLVSSVSYK